MATSRARVCSVVAAIAALGVALLDARQQQPPTFRSNARLVELSVVVTDRLQRPVTGLTADDFEVYDEGKPQSVELFSIEAAGTTARAAPSPARNGREFSNRMAVTGGVTIILLDQLNTGSSSRMFARDHVIRFLEQIRPSDRVGLYVLDTDGVLRVLHDFTNDATSLVRAVARMRDGVSGSLAGQEDAARIEDAFADLVSAESPGEAPGEAMRKHYRGSSALWTIDALESIGRHLSGVQSRKNLIWVSAGFALVAFDERGRSKTGEINRATRALNDANVALYTIDARGLLPGLTSVQGRPVITTLSMVTTNQDILQSLAENTGGRAFLNTNDINGAVRRAADDALLTYVLGYYPTNDVWDGRFHRINVKVKRPGLEIRHRKGYFAVATQKQAAAQRAAALQAAVASAIDATGVGMTLRIDPAPSTPAEYRLTLRVEPGAITLERRGNEASVALDVVVAQIAADGVDVGSFQDRVDVTLSGDRLQRFLRDGMIINHTMTMTPAAERLRVVVRDVRTGALGAIGVSTRQLQAIAR